jgi:hypothetical protein
VHRANDDAQRHAVVVELGDVSRRRVGECRRCLFAYRRQRDPQLQAVQALATTAPVGTSAFGMHNATPGRHPVDLARPDRHCGTEAVAMHDLAIK